MAAAERIEVADASARERYELSVDGEVAGFTAHLARPGLIAFVHTEADERVQGRALSRAQPADHATADPRAIATAFICFRSDCPTRRSSNSSIRSSSLVLTPQ